MDPPKSLALYAGVKPLLLSTEAIIICRQSGRQGIFIMGAKWRFLKYQGQIQRGIFMVDDQISTFQVMGWSSCDVMIGTVI